LAKNKKRKNRSVPDAKCIRLNDQFGNFLRLMTRDELDFMCALGYPIKKMTLSIWQEIPPVTPSNSSTSPICLTGGSQGGVNMGDGGDMHALAGMNFSESRMTTPQRERLIGHGVLRERTFRNKVEKLITRVLHATEEELALGDERYATLRASQAAA
jgi:hypothetical protein